MSSYTILHISDLHRSPDDPITNDEIVSALVADFDRYQLEDPPINPPDAIIVSGDVIQGVPLSEPDYQAKLERQYELAAALLDELANRFLNDDKSKMVIIPGNHDVDWNTAFSSMTEIPASSIPVSFASNLAVENSIYRWDWKKRIAYQIFDIDIYEKRLECYWNFFQKFYNGVVGLPKVDPWSDANVYLLHDGQIAVAAFNSCHGNDCFALHGSIKKDAIARADLNLRDEKFAGLRIAVWHHNLDGPPYRTDYMDIDIVRGMIGRGFRLGLYGHQHKAQLTPFQIWLPKNETMALVSAGSLCAGRKELPTGYTRQYNVLEIAENLSGVRVHVREMSVANLFVKGRFSDLGGVSYVDLNWELPKNKVGGTINLKKVQLQNKIMEAEEALKKENFDLAVEILDSVELNSNSYQRNIFIEAAEKAHKWNSLIDRITPNTPVELESLLNAYQQLKDFEGALRVLKRFSTIVGMPTNIEDEFKRSIEVNKKIYQNV